MKRLLEFLTPERNLRSGGNGGKNKDKGNLHKAAAVGDLEKFRQLAPNNDIDQPDKYNRTALYIACACGHVELVQFLLQSKASVNLCDNENTSALMKAVQYKHERCVRLLLEQHAAPNLADIKGNTALHSAASTSSVESAALLLDYGAEIDAKNKEAFTPLTVAVREDGVDMAELLLWKGANVNIVDHNKRSPLMMAAGNRRIRMVQLLLQFDPDTSLRDNKGRSAGDYAAKSGLRLFSVLMAEHNTPKNRERTSSHRQDTLLTKEEHQRTNVREMMAQRKKEANAEQERMLNGTKSEQESTRGDQRISTRSGKPPQHPADPIPISFQSKAPQMTSDRPLSSRTKSSPQSPEKPQGEKKIMLHSQDDQQEKALVKEDTEDDLSNWDSDSSDVTLPSSDMASPVAAKFAERSKSSARKLEEESSNWDSDSTDITPPGSELASPVVDRFAGSSNSSTTKQDEENGSPLLTPRSILKSSIRPSISPSQPQPHSQPRAKRMTFQLPEGRDVTVPQSGLEADNLASPSPTANIEPQNMSRSQAAFKQAMAKDEETVRSDRWQGEVMSPLLVASDRERDLLQQMAATLPMLKTDLQRMQTNNSPRQVPFSEENEMLKQQLEDPSLKSGALTQTGDDSSKKLAIFESELSMMRACLDNERRANQILQMEVEYAHMHLSEAVTDAGSCQEAQRKAERALLQEREAHQRLKDRLTGEAAGLFEANSLPSQKLAMAEARAEGLASEVHRVMLQLAEKDSLLDSLQQDKDRAVARVKELERIFHAEREMMSRTGAHLAQAQNEMLFLQKQREGRQIFSDKKSSDCERRVKLAVEKNRELAGEAADFRDQIHKWDEDEKQRQLRGAPHLYPPNPFLGLISNQQSLPPYSPHVSLNSWEERLMKHSELRTRLTELENERGELRKKMDKAKQRAREAEERKGFLETRLDQQMMRNAELQLEVHRLHRSLKVAEMTLLDVNIGGTEYGSHMSYLWRDRDRHSQMEWGFGQMKNKVDKLQTQLEREVSLRSRLEQENEGFKDLLESQKTFMHSNDDLQWGMKQLEVEVLDLNRRVEASELEKSKRNQYLQARSQREVKEKLDQFNLFLQSGATSQKARDIFKATVKAGPLAWLEPKVVRFDDNCSARLKLKPYKHFCTEETHHRQSLATKPAKYKNDLDRCISEELRDAKAGLETITTRLTQKASASRLKLDPIRSQKKSNKI